MRSWAAADDKRKHRFGMKDRKSAGDVELKLFDPRSAGVAFKVERIGVTSGLSQPQRCNYFSVLWIRNGKGKFHTDLANYDFQSPALLFANPYQTFFLDSDEALEGVCLQFHANFFCIETYHEEVGCNGVLFNNLYGAPIVRLDDQGAREFEVLISRMKSELEGSGLAQAEVLVSYLKIFLIGATRLKLEQQQQQFASGVAAPRPPQALQRLAELIEEHYRTKRSPSEYAALLHLSPKTLGKLVKSHWHKTPTELIRERLLKHAQWQLLHTARPVKEIAWEVGFEDEHYFSRLFKRVTGRSPTAFREFETAIRGGRNLSMH